MEDCRLVEGIELLVNFVGVKGTDSAPYFIACAVEQDEGGGVAEAQFVQQRFGIWVLYVEQHDAGFIPPLPFQPIHDGFSP